MLKKSLLIIMDGWGHGKIAAILMPFNTPMFLLLNLYIRNTLMLNLLPAVRQLVYPMVKWGIVKLVI
jgi:hypothetical protein